LLERVAGRSECYRATLVTATVLVVSLSLAHPARSAESAAERPKVDFARQVQPIFIEHCYACHGPDKQESGLRLDVPSSALKGGDSGALLVAGKSKDSELFKRIATADDDERMPPAKANAKPLTSEQMELITRWIDEGAVWPEGRGNGSTHWAYQPIQRPDPPTVKNPAWARGAIDRFVLARLESRSIEPSPEADRATLIKRLSYDLLGLPPKVEDVDAFVQDPSPNAYEKLVDTLLDSPHFGERWGRHWLDMARYADSDGYEKDNPRPDAWRYRDWVIDAINADLPLDQFTIEQLAGDLLPDATPTQKLATAFHRQTLTNTEGGTDQEQFRVEANFDRVATTGSVWLGLTVGCAQCHTHKYDAITHDEYYQLFAFFNNGDEVETEVPLTGEALAKWASDKNDAEGKLSKLEPKLETLRAELTAKLPAWEAELRSKPAVPLEFRPVELVSAKSSAESELKLHSDGSYLVTGKSPEVDKVTITAKTDLKEITGFRIETLTHDQLPGRGPGRNVLGNFVLSEFRVLAAGDSDFKAEQRVPMLQAQADFEQSGFSAAAAIDGKDATGWAVSPQMGRDHWITLIAKQPISGEATPWLQLVLAQNQGQQHTIGRFRIMAVTGHDPLFGIPPAVREVLAIENAKRTPEQSASLLEYYIGQDSKAQDLLTQRKKLQERLATKPLMKVRVLAQRLDKPRASHVLRRGDFLQPEAEVRPAGLSVLHPLNPRVGGAPDRLDLARWLVDAANPLTPRVMMNQLWSNLFVQGIVRTPNDFGVRGDRPTHPELLDWLAAELPRQGWSRKQMIRLIVSSATYRQASKHRPELAETDPLNELLARQNRYRVEAEIVRDLALSAGGLLADKIGGQSVFPPLPPDIAELSYANNFKWTNSTGEDRYRRGMYTFFKRTAPHPNLTTFDCPDSNTTTIQRRTSNTPLQALTTLNNEAFVEASQALAKRALAGPAATDQERLAKALRWCIARAPGSDEVKSFDELLASSRQWYAAHPDEATTAVGKLAAGGQPAIELAAWVSTVRMMLNLDEFLTRE